MKMRRISLNVTVDCELPRAEFEAFGGEMTAEIKRTLVAQAIKMLQESKLEDLYFVEQNFKDYR